jgi:cleavage and polyadenylation specificity factor subunit 1
LFRNTALNKDVFKIGGESEDEIEMDYFCLVCWTSGALEIYTVPHFEQVFSFFQFTNLFPTVYDEAPTTEERLDFIQNNASNVRHPFVAEIMLQSIGVPQTSVSKKTSYDEDPHLLVLLSDDTLQVYRAFGYDQNIRDRRLGSLRFAKVQHDEYLPKSSTVSGTGDMSETIDLDADNIFISHHGKQRRRNMFISFPNIGGLSGVFLKGEKPAWFLTERGFLRIHPMSQDGQPIHAFAPYHNNQSCAYGFMYYLERGSMFRVCQFSDDPFMKYNSFWPTRKIPLRCTPHIAAYHQETKCCLIATSTAVKSIPLEEYDTLPENGRFPPPMEEKYTLKLFSGRTWTEMDHFDLEPNEQVLCLKTVYLSREEINSDDEDEDQMEQREKKEGEKKDLTSYMAVGTGIQLGEDEACLGRVIIFDLEPQEVNLNSVSNETLYKLNPVCIKDLKGPVSSVSHLEGYLIVSVGPKLYVYFYDWKNKQLVPASFYDAQFYVTSMNTIKNYIIYADMFKNLHLMRWREKGHRLNLLGKDYRHLTAGGSLADVLASEYLVDQDNLGLVSVDGDKNLQIFSYAPKSAESIGGKRLLPIADFHTGSYIISMTRMKMRVLDSNQNAIVNYQRGTRGQDRLTVRTNPNKQFILFGTLDGSIGYLACIDEPTHRRMSMLQTKMYTQLQHAGGLHPKAFRLFRSKGDHHIQKKNIIDGQLLWRYANLSTVTPIRVVTSSKEKTQ